MDGYICKCRHTQHSQTAALDSYRVLGDSQLFFMLYQCNSPSHPLRNTNILFVGLQPFLKLLSFLIYSVAKTYEPRLNKSIFKNGHFNARISKWILYLWLSRVIRCPFYWAREKHLMCDDDWKLQIKWQGGSYQVWAHVNITMTCLFDVPGITWTPWWMVVA